MKTKRSACLAISLLVGAALASSYAQAMSCPGYPEAKKIEVAQVAFVGTVIAVRDSDYSPHSLVCWTPTQDRPACGGKVATLAVEEVLRGKPAKTVTVLSEDACYCLGAPWRKGEKYLVVATPHRVAKDNGADLLAGSTCWGTGLAYRSERLIERFRRARRERQGR